VTLQSEKKKKGDKGGGTEGKKHSSIGKTAQRPKKTGANAPGLKREQAKAGLGSSTRLPKREKEGKTREIAGFSKPTQ